MERVRTISNAIATILGVLGACPAWADTRVCDAPYVTVTFQNAEDGEMTCEAAQEAATLFASCNLPAINRPIQIDVVEDLSQDCAALYHCGEDKIEVLSVQEMHERRDPDGAFRHLAASDYFQSVVVHELSHAATDNIPCPFSACIAADEYIAYAMQIMSLPPQAQRVFENQSGVEDTVSADELSAIILYMAPHLFTTKAWAHLSQRDDPCGYIGQLLDRSILLDRERF